MNVRCPSCGAAVALAVGDTRLACAACGLATPVSRVGTEPGTAAGAVLALETDLVGSTLAGRTIAERIGAGGMGTVYRASDGTTDVAVKVIRPALGNDRAAALARFAREAEALRRLEHPRVVRFLEHGEDGGVAYIVTELVRGKDLAATLAAGKLPLARIVELFGQVCDGVAAAHAAGIVHRDLKPANILVGDDGAVKVADFGLAQLGPDAAVTTLTRTDVAMGTFHYLAPEQRKDARNIDHRADVWALGVIFYEMLTGELPLGSFAPASAKGPPGCDRRADAIVRRALAPDPADRFASVAEMGSAVRRLLPRPGERKRLAITAAAMLAFAGTAGAVAMRVTDDKPAAKVAAVAEVAADADAVTTAPDAAELVVVADAPPAIDAPPIEVAAAKPIDVADGKSVDTPKTAPPAKPKPPKPPTKPPTKRPTKPEGKPVAVGKVKGGKSKADEAAGSGDEPFAGSASSSGSASEVPRVCRTAYRCCQVVKGGKCATQLRGDQASCTTALADFRALATSKKQLGACGG